MTLKNNKNHNQLTNLELSIQISLSGLSFCTLHRDTNTITNLKHIDFDKKLNPLDLLDKLTHLFNSETALQTQFAKVNVVHINELSTLVPKPFFNEDCLADYLKFNSKILKSDFIAFDDMKSIDSVNVYIPYVNINNFIYEKFGSFTYKHFSTVLIEQILRIEKNNSVTKVYVNVSSDHFEIVIVKKGKLVLYNTFEYSTKEDFIYYILFAAEQLQLNPENLSLLFLGNVNKGDQLYKIAYKYIRYVFLGNREDEFKYSVDAQPESYHSNFTLINSL